MTSTLAQIRQAAAPLIGSFQKATATTSTTTTVVFATWPLKTSRDDSDLYTDHFIYRPDAANASDRMRMVAGSSGYIPSTGTITPDLAYTAAPTGEAVELHGAIPPLNDDINDWRALINLALRDLWVPVEFTFSPSANTDTRHSMASAASWLTDPADVLRVGKLSASETRAQTDPYTRVIRGEGFKDRGTVYLTGFSGNTDDVFYVNALAPAYSYCAAAASPTTFTQSGLSAESDVCLAETRRAAVATLVKAWERLGTILAAGNADRAIAEQRKWASELTHANEEAARSLPDRTFGQRPTRWGP